MLLSVLSDSSSCSPCYLLVLKLQQKPDWLVHFRPSVLSYVVQISQPGSMEEGLNQIFAGSDRAAAV